MIGLVIKDLKIMFKRIKPINYLIIAMITISIMIYFKGEGAFYVSVFFPLVLSGVPKTLMIYDEQCKWDRYAISLPVTKKQIIGSRYLFFLITVVAASLIALLVNIISYLIFQSIPLDTYLFTVFLGLLLAIFYGLITIPAGYGMGTNGGPFAMLISTFLIIAIFYILKRMNVDIKMLISHFEGNIIIIGLAFLLIVSLISFNASLRFYNGKHS